MAYGIIRVEKVKRAAVGSMQYHNDRVPGEHSNGDIDPDKTPYNEEFVRHGSYRAEVADRIERFRDGARKVRKDAVVLCEGIATASPEFFEGKTHEEVMAYFRDVYEFVRAEAGEENLIHFTVHMDETTPHAHFGFTPIKDGALSWKKFFDGKYALRAFQDRYWEQVGREWGLERGEKSEDTGRKHRDTQQMKRDAARELHEVEQRVEQTSERLEGLQQREVQLGEEIEELQPVAVTLAESVRTLVSSRGDGGRERELAAEKEQLGAGIVELERQVADARERVGELEAGMPGLRERRDRARERDQAVAERFEAVERRVTEAIGRLREVPETLSEWALEIANKLGIRTYNPNSLEHQARLAREAAGRSGINEPSRAPRRGWDAR